MQSPVTGPRTLRLARLPSEEESEPLLHALAEAPMSVSSSGLRRDAHRATSRGVVREVLLARDS